MLFHRAALVAVGLTLLAGCDSVPTAPTRVAVPPGKADNYLSPVVQEYDIEGTARVTLSAEDQALGDQEREQRLQELVREEVDRITRALSSKLQVLAPEGQTHDDDGVIVFLRELSTGFADLQADEEGEHSFTYRAEAAATANLLPFDDGKRELELELTPGSADDRVTLRFTASPEVKDSYPRYKELFKDGLDIYVQYGGDYNERRWDLKKSRALFDTLKTLGFEAPTASYDELKLDSPPFTGKLDVDGTEVAVRVKLVHPDMVPDDELDKLVEAYKEHAKADVVIYSGHASEDTSYSGVVVHYNPRKALPATAFKDLDLPDSQQIFVFIGCHTYTGYADRLLEHPGKTTDNTDVITAVSTTPLSRDIVGTLLGGLLDQSEGTWFPHTWEALLERINEESERSWRGAFGVHGLEQNPRISPLADPATVGQACKDDADCPGIDNLCVLPLLSVTRSCGAACTDSRDCPAGTHCWWTFAGGLKPERQCVKH